jgi:GntR family transcriptional regulator
MDSGGRVKARGRSLSAISLDRSSKVPLYRQIEEHVRRMLARKTAPDGRVFTEQELARCFGVSRLTVRQAITALVDEGKLARVRGVGTLRISVGVTESLERVRDHFVDWESEGRSVSLQNLDFTQVEAGSSVARRLGIPEHTEVLRLIRLWIVDGVPIGLVYFYLHPSIARALSRSDVENTHVRVAVSRRLRVPMLGEQVEIEAGVASRVTAGGLKIRAGDPVLIGRLTQFYGDRRPLVAADCYYRADLYRYSVYVPAQSDRADAAVHTLGGGPVTMRAIAAGRRAPSAAGPRRRPKG